MNRWKVNKAYGIWYAIEHGWKRYQGFPTWAEAMAYADRYSRLAPDITIEDPSGAFCDLTATNKREYIHLKSGGDTFNLAPHEWRPLAGFLLDVANLVEEA
ncbi:hypothetical protein HMPREF2604_07450 [Corynebacterium sp. HMSC055A01]|uniref:hypothetical protein n=1 Tax=Corynebacterium sp. HMSC055A01 TaxID=1715083 RepID=UPI0008A4AD91|nr:hypothetical protein [Corynebacterium sp. HMSC055A01]OFN17767.1 hypothetical protein HMPREF2604_07450 [Corynebacterium sp. HMSC055A01]